MINRLIESVEQTSLKQNAAPFAIGDSVDVATRIVEGDKERIQVFSGTVIMRKGRGMNETFTVRRIVNNEGVERIFPINSPYISSITVKRGGRTRRAKLFYLRTRVGKAVRLTEKKKSKRDDGQAASGKQEPVKERAETPELAAAAS